jgi:hypothetical protein
MNSLQNEIQYYKLNNTNDIAYNNGIFWLLNKSERAKKEMPFNLQLELIISKPVWIIHFNNPCYELCYELLISDPINFHYMNEKWDCYQEIKELYNLLTNY